MWDWVGYSFSDVGVGIHTNFPATFQPGFDLTRTWDPEPITSSSVTQTLTVEFTSSTEYAFDFFNAHVSVHIPNTPEASPTIDPDSISADPPEDQREIPWNMWLDSNEEGYTVNWNGDPKAGVTYTFSVDVTVENEFYPMPILYKPSVGVGANYDMIWGPIVEDVSVTIPDDMDGNEADEATVTYSITGVTGGEAYKWQTITQRENSVSFSSHSAIVGETGHFWASFVSTTGGEMWSNLYGFGHMSTPWHGSIVEWNVDEVQYFDDSEDFTGTFTIEVTDQSDYVRGGQIHVSFDTKLERIPLIPGEPNAHIHFWGKFEITDGTRQYAGLKGCGKISGTIHLHEDIDVEPPYYDLVMIGEYKTKQIK